VSPKPDLARILRDGLEQLPGTSLDGDQGVALLGYVDLLQRWNRTYNLTAIHDPAEMVSRHLLDSLAVLPWVEETPLLDAGAGAGLPGIPLAIARPGLAVTLLDSAGKKVRFMNHVCRELSLGNVRAVQARLESWQPEQACGQVISRAFASLADFATAARHLAAASLRLLAMKGRYPETELEDLPDWVRVAAVEKLAVPGLQEERHLVIMSVNP
jgi:16S rRNA (guanine527-N7)-methyltransferase